MKLLTGAIVALTALSATATFAQADDWDHHNRDWHHRHHGPVIIVEHRHNDWDRHHHWQHMQPHRHHYYNG